MKDIFAQKNKDSFFDILRHFVESLMDMETYPEIEAWAKWSQNVTDEDERTKCLQHWVDALDTPLAKKTAKYGRAVKSITGKKATVYHAIVYRDMPAMVTNSTYIASLIVPSKLADMSAEDKVLFWQYMKELSESAFKALRRSIPAVPSPSEIGDDICKRKGTSHLPSQALKTGFKEMWTQLCATRAAVVDESLDMDDVATKLSALTSTVVNDVVFSSLCTARDVVAFEKIVEVFPYLNAATLFTESEWAMFEQCMSLAMMHTNIPKPMMQGIETVATKLLSDIQSGKADLASLDVDAIGKQVLSGVSQNDIEHFAKNMDKIIPSITQL